VSGPVNIRPGYTTPSLLGLEASMSNLIALYHVQYQLDVLFLMGEPTARFQSFIMLARQLPTFYTAQQPTKVWK
jgi:hypothetical protein